MYIFISWVVKIIEWVCAVSTPEVFDLTGDPTSGLELFGAFWDQVTGNWLVTEMDKLFNEEIL